MAFPIVGALFGVANTLIDRLIPDKNANGKAKLSLEMMLAKGELDTLAKGLEGNLKINEVEAAHPSIFVAGARPFIMWVCGITFAYHYLVYPIIMAIAAFKGFDTSVLPKFELQDLMYVMGSMLGIGGFRSYEKLRGVARDNMKQTLYGKGSKNYKG